MRSTTTRTVFMIHTALAVGCVSPPAILGVADGTGTGSQDGSGATGASAGSTGAPGDSTGAVSMTGNQGEDTGTGGAPQSCLGIDRFGGQANAQPSLTTAQWDAIVADLIGVDARIARDGGGIDTATEIATYDSVVDLIPTWADQAAQAADLSLLLSCDPATVAGAAALGCLTAFVEPLAETAWRRPLTNDEQALLVGALGSTADFAGDVRAAIALVLRAPDFWQYTPAGTPTADAAVIALDGPSLALRLSLALWNGLPDDELRALAADGSLLAPEIRAAQIERMLTDVRAERMVRSYYANWLDIDQLTEVEKDEALFPAFDAALAADMREESERFAADVLLRGDGRAETLLTAPYTFVNADLWELYGDAVVSDLPVRPGDAFARVDLDPARRGGLLTQPAWLSVHSHANLVGFTRRGLWLLQSLPCYVIPPHPPSVDEPVPEPPQHGQGLGNKGWRQAVLNHSACPACHNVTDPPSFAFDNYDAIGQWVDEVFGDPVDPSGVLWDGPAFANRAELMAELLARDEAGACMPIHWAIHTLGREVTEEDDGCLIEQLRDGYVASDGDLRQAIAAIAASDAFAHMRMAE